MPLQDQCGHAQAEHGRVRHGFQQRQQRLEAAASHGADAAGRAMRIAYDRAGMHSHGGDQRGVPQRHQRRHARARRQPCDVDPFRVQAVPRDFRADQRRDQIGFRTAVLGVGLEPAPAALHLASHRLLRIQHHEAAGIRPLVHARAARERQRRLPAAMQHHDHRHVGARPRHRRIARERQLAPLAIGELPRRFPTPAAQ
ncbi:hypothetical protein D3C71_1462060 [compost metagenome]